FLALAISANCTPLEENLGVKNGVPLVQGMFPWIASLGYRESPTKWFSDCTGALIDETHVLTAAHCVVHYATLIDKKKYQITMDPESVYNVQKTYKIKTIFAHEDYKEDGTFNDIAII